MVNLVVNRGSSRWLIAGEAAEGPDGDETPQVHCSLGSEYSEESDVEDQAESCCGKPSGALLDVKRPGSRRFPDIWTDIIRCIEGNAVLRFVDGWIATFVMTVLILYIAISLTWTVTSLIYGCYATHNMLAMDVTRLVNHLTLCVTLLLIWLLWHSTCFHDKYLERFWQSGNWMQTRPMAGGFIPRPAAASMGLLLFLNGSLIRTHTVMGKDLTKYGWNGEMGNYDSCRANSLELAIYGGDGPIPLLWFQRLYRESADGCFDSKPQKMLGFRLPDLFFAAQQTFTNLGNLTAEQLANPLLIPRLVHPIIDGVEVKTKYCTYQCGEFRAFAFSSIISDLGSIFAGAAIIVKVADMITTRVGWYLVTENTNPAELVHALVGHRMPPDTALEIMSTGEKDEWVQRFQNIYVRHPGSPTLAAFQLLGVFGFACAITPYLTRDGFFTVDYYTMAIMTVSVLSSLMLRCWSPFNCRSIIFTRKLWTEGADEFSVFSRTAHRFEKKTITLYDWVHTPRPERMKLLLRYCRSIASDDLDGVYNENGFIPALEEVGIGRTCSQASNGIEQKSMTHIMCELLVSVCSFLSLIISPWRWCSTRRGTHDLSDQHKIKVITTQNVKITKKCIVWQAADADDRKVLQMDKEQMVSVHHFQRVVLDDYIKGYITKLSQVPGHVEVEFNYEGRHAELGGGGSIGYLLGKDDGIHGDDRGNILNQPVPADDPDLPFAQWTWTFDVPLSAVTEVSPAWSFARLLLGEKSLSEQLMDKPSLGVSIMSSQFS